jgi:exodeoxyribonuclease VII large subunit
MISAETYSVGLLCAEIQEILSTAYDSVWVVGEVQRLRKSQRGHQYLELIEKGADDEIIGKLESVIWRTNARQIQRQLAGSGQEIAEGQQIRLRGNLDFYGPFGRLQFVVREVDPVFGAGLLAQRRRETLLALEAAGLLTRNRQMRVAKVPLTVGLVTSDQSAAYHDFLSTIRESGYGFKIEFVHAAVQGKDSARDVVSAIELLSSRVLDCIVVVRGGGSQTDLASFDSRAIATAIAQAPLPVLTGIGHETDETISDLVSHTALKTPTKVAEYLVGRVAGSEEALARVAGGLALKAGLPLGRAREKVLRAERSFQVCQYRLNSTAQKLHDLERAMARGARRRLAAVPPRVEEIGGQIVRNCQRAIARRQREPAYLAQMIVARARAEIAMQRARLEGWNMAIGQLSPQRTLERGFAIARDQEGVVLKDAAQLASGDRVYTQLARGRFSSEVLKR